MTEAAGTEAETAARESAASDHHAVELIRAKRDGQRLTDAQIRWLFDRYLTAGPAPSPTSRCPALPMAIYFQGLDTAELRTWTAAMIHRGSGWTCPGWAVPPWTSTPPAVSATRCR